MDCKKYSVVIAGAGPAGISAALEAARSGARVALIERYGCVGGMLTHGYVGPLLGSVCAGTITEEIERKICPIPGFCPDFELAKNALTAMLADAGVDVYLQTQVTGAVTNSGRIESIRTDGKFGTFCFTARTYIDATGDGDLSVLAGCPYEMGRKGDHLVQPVTLMFVIQGVDPDQSLLCMNEEHYTDLGDGREYLDLCHKACKSGELPKNVNIVRLYKTAYAGERMVNATQENRINPLDPADVFRAEAELRRQIDQIMAFLKNNIPGFANIRIKGGSSTLGVRESRRIMADHLLTEQELVAGQTFPDGVVHKASFCLDIHNPDGPGQSVDEEGLPRQDKPYDIPFSAMTPLGIDNLITAGRCISGTHVAMSSYRVMRICMAMGQAAGAAAYLMEQTGTEKTRELDVGKIRAHLIARGVALES
ncbi:MAG: FAD-dependent oxidoreductase [Eubacteriales bacterium]